MIVGAILRMSPTRAAAGPSPSAAFLRIHVPL